MNVLDTDKRAQILNCLVEGCSMRSTARLTGAAKKTVERLLVSAGTACAEYMDEHMRGLTCRRIQLDEIWSFVYAKQRNVPGAIGAGLGAGDCWTWIAIDADTKLIPSWFVGNRSSDSAMDFVHDLKTRLANRVQITSDGYACYLQTIAALFNADGTDYAILHKTYNAPLQTHARYSPPVCTGIRTEVIFGKPDRKHISTSFVERQNLTVRMSNRRCTRLTNAFSKKFENHVHMMAIHFMHYNYCRIHQTLRTTPAMAAGISNHVWSLEEVVDLIA